MAAAKIFDGFCISMVGSLPSSGFTRKRTSQTSLIDMITSNATIKRVASAKESGTIKIVHIRWLLDSIRRGKALVEETYQFGEIKGIQNALIRELIFEDPGWRKRTIAGSSIYSDPESGLRYEERLSRLEEASEDTKKTAAASQVVTMYTIAGKCPEATLCILIDVYKSEIKKIQEEGHQTMGPESVDEPEHTPATLLARDAFYNLVKYIAGSTTVPENHLGAKSLVTPSMESEKSKINLTINGHDDTLRGYLKLVALKDMTYGMIVSKIGHQ
ncbi:uncharacterized protein H6S33_012201 [Morchella sextelata]|uniref:uncharacterized protein n=1 Tax=Morchella sextelata TaxID=1174677 RepID=UPI001D04EE12|nr:uncharacterized protein H6S33_012201 [Morchella sextelata]KAH0610674.1 hypothetical protein H6S33_012201 [Morchella sextelata]